MAEEPRTEVSVELSVRKKETWIIKIGDLFDYNGYTVKILAIPSKERVTLEFSKEGERTVQANWGIADMPGHGFVQKYPHDFSDRYCAAKHVDGSVVLLCKDCGTSEQLANGVKCAPRDWRADLESYLGGQMAHSDAKRRVPPRHVERFAQSHPLVAGGVFSLRDES